MQFKGRQDNYSDSDAVSFIQFFLCVDWLRLNSLILRTRLAGWLSVYFVNLENVTQMFFIFLFFYLLYAVNTYCLLLQLLCLCCWHLCHFEITNKNNKKNRFCDYFCYSQVITDAQPRKKREKFWKITISLMDLDFKASIKAFCSLFVLVWFAICL